MKKLLLCLLAGVDTGITFRPPTQRFSIRSRAGKSSASAPR